MTGSKKNIINRYKFILLLIFLFAAMIAGKLFKTTVVDAAAWNDLAEKSLRDSVVIYPQRGNILAADGSLLAANVMIYDLRIDFGASPFRADTLKKYVRPLCDSIHSAIDRSVDPGKMSKDILAQFEKYEQAKERYNKAVKEKKPDLVKKELRKEMNRARKVTLLTKRPAIDMERLLSFKFFRTKGGRGTLDRDGKNKRLKPFGTMAAQSIGAVAEKELDNGTVVVHGVTGLERSLDSLLFGTPGLGGSIQLTNGIRTWAEIEPQRGYDIVTTIDIRIQDILETELRKKCAETKAEWGTAVLMDVETGEIKAISNLRRDNADSTYHEGLNYALMGFEPGSVMKPISMMIALEDKLARLNEKIPTGKSFPYAGGRPINDSHAYNSLTPAEIIEVSSNIGMAKITLRGFEKEPWTFRERLAEIGMFDPMNLGIYGERIPVIPKLGNKNWDRISLSRICYGYSTRIPPIYTLMFYNAFANGGKLVRPRIVKELWKNDVCDTVFPVSYVRERICSPETAKEICGMLKSVVWGDHGTARALRNNFVSISGKTGTAYDIVDGKYSNKKRLAFCGFFPSDKPKYSCVVLMSHANKGAAYSSGMVLMNTALKMYARGMLGNVSDYRKESDNDNTPATLYAASGSSTESLKQGIGLQSVRKMQSRKTDSGVPSVLGMGLREAVMTLEKAGINVDSLQGNGYVYSQSLPPGTKYKKGTKISLKLKD